MRSPEQFGAKLSEHYTGYLGSTTAEESEPVFSEKEINQILKDLFDGSEAVSEELFKGTYSHLNKGVETGYGSITNPNDAVMVQQLKTNIAVFAAFKANHYGTTMRTLLVDEKGTKRTYGEFRKEAIKIDPKYNQQWLAAEYNMATRQARSADQWQRFKRDQDVYPNLEYMPSRSPNQRDSHTKWYGIVLPIDDPFWDTAMPPSQGWGCKCWVRQSNAPTTSKEPEAPLSLPGIEGNAGKAGRVFSASHPFITAVSKADKPAVKKAFQEYKANLSDIIEMKVGKNNAVIIKSNAASGDLLENVNFAQAVVKKYRKNMIINSHAENKKNPEYTYNKVIGDMTKFEGSDPVKYVKNTFGKLQPKAQLGGLKECFLALDFDGKMNVENYYNTIRLINGRMVSNPKVKFIIAKNGDKMVMLTDKMDFYKKIALIKKELL